MAGRKSGENVQAVRLLRMLEQLRASRVGVTAQELAARFDISTKQARRDLERIEELYQLEEVAERPRRVRLSEPSMKPVQISYRERYALLAVRRVFDVLRDTPLREDIESVFCKLIASLPARDRAQLEAFEDRFVYLPDGGIKRYEHKVEVLDELMNGVLKRERIDYCYDKGDGARPSSGVLEPFAMVLYKQGLYVLGRRFDRGRPQGGPRVFASERFTHARWRRGESFRVPQSFRLERHFDGAFGIFVGGEATEVAVEFSPEVAHNVRSRVWHRGQRLLPLPGGGVRLEFRVRHTAQVIPWVLSWGPRARLVHPPALVRELRAALDQARALYTRPQLAKTTGRDLPQTTGASAG